MRVFVTGASGYIGNAVAKAFRRAGHQVFGLVRSDRSAHDLLKNEIHPVKGDLADPKTLHHVMQNIEAVAHCAAESTGDKAQRDFDAISYFLDTLSSFSHSSAFVYTSGIWVYGNRNGSTVDEYNEPSPLKIVKWRPAHEQKVLSHAKNQVRTVVIRPGFVFGKSGGLTSIFFEGAKKGEVFVIEEGKAHWPMVHVDDLATLYVLAAEQPHPNMILNAAADNSLTMRQVAEAIVKVKAAKITSLSYDKALTMFGPVVEGLNISLQVKSEKAKNLLRWNPRMPHFNKSTEEYFKSWEASVDQKK
jgi:nucleoside-diphosphate-sugar epimerase